MHNIIILNKKFDIFLNPYYLDTFSSLISTTEIVDKVTYCYLRLFLVQVDKFYKIEIEYEIA